MINASTKRKEFIESRNKRDQSLRVPKLLEQSLKVNLYAKHQDSE